MSRLRWHGVAVTARVTVALDKALGEAAEHLLEHANRTIPHDTGHMMRSGTTTRLSATERVVSYDTPYAVRQHEDTRLRHADGRRARWLAIALDERRESIIGYLKRAARAVM